MGEQNGVPICIWQLRDQNKQGNMQRLRAVASLLAAESLVGASETSTPVSLPLSLSTRSYQTPATNRGEKLCSKPERTGKR